MKGRSGSGHARVYKTSGTANRSAENLCCHLDSPCLQMLGADPALRQAMNPATAHASPEHLLRSMYDFGRNSVGLTVLPPVVVDADVLLRNVDYSVSHAWQPALIGAAVGNPLPFDVMLVATSRVQDEVERHLTDIAIRRDVDIEFVLETWNEVFLPILRFVELGDDWTDDPRIDAVRSLHENDAPTAVLAIALGSCILLTDNRRHFEPLELPDRPSTVMHLPKGVLQVLSLQVTRKGHARTKPGGVNGLF